MLKKLNFDDGLVRAEWQDLYCRNHHLLPYASREYNELFNKYFRLDGKRLFLQKRFYGFYDEDERLQIIVPLCIKGKDIHIFGDFGNGEILDFIYPHSIEPECFQQLFKDLQQEFAGYTLILNRLAPNSPLRVWLEKSKYKSVHKKSLAQLRLPSSYEEYLQCLPTAVRGDVNRAEKFMAQLGVPYKLEFARGSISNELRRKYAGLYEQNNNSTVSKLKTFTERYSRRKFNAITDACTKESNSFNSCLYIGNKLSAFASGFFDLDEKRLFMRKSATNMHYVKNMTATFLYMQTIKFMIEKTDFEWLDIGDAREKYRHCLGCEEYFCYSYEVKL